MKGIQFGTVPLTFPMPFFSKLGLKLPWASKKSRLGETVPTTAQVARVDGGSSGSVGMSTRSFWLLDFNHWTCEMNLVEAT